MRQYEIVLPHFIYVIILKNYSDSGKSKLGILASLLPVFR